MADLLAQERATEQHVLTVLTSADVPAADLLALFRDYRLLAEAATYADLDNAESHEQRLWTSHAAGRKWFSKRLRDFRKKHSDRPVEERQWAKGYMHFLKESEKSYRAYITKVNKACGGILELEAIAHQSTGEDSGESQPPLAPPMKREAAILSVHRTLTYLGDLARYRAADKLDQKPDFSRAVGWYELAASILPYSGIGHHQLAVVALEDQRHLQGIYHFYRSIAVPQPHPFGLNNLGKEFEKTNAAWDRGELIQKGPPNDPDTSKNALIGWFVRFHSMCYKGEEFRGHEELEREVLSQLSNVIKQRPLNTTLQRMIFTNLAAQWVAGESYQGRTVSTPRNILGLTSATANTTNQLERAFLSYFRFNVKTFTTLLQVFYDDLRNFLINLEDQDVELSAKLTPLGRRILPFLRIYTNWLLTSIVLVQGLFGDGFVGASVQQFWPTYARVIDLIAQAFPIWDLEDVDDVEYLLEEDVDSRQFKPVFDEERTAMRWMNKQTDSMKPCCTDKNVVRVSPDEEMLQRVKDFLADGLNMANNDELPINIRGTRIFFGSEDNVDALVVRPIEYQPAPIAPAKAQGKPKPISYAAAAANGQAKLARPLPVQRKASASKPQSRDAQLSRMVDDLVDDDDGNNPVTPPQQHASNPTVVTNGEAPQLQDVAMHDLTHAMKNVAARPNVTATPTPAHTNRTAGNVPRPYTGQRERMQSVSRLWENGQAPASSFPHGLPAGTPLGSPMVGVRGHSRGNSASSIRSVGDPWTSDSAPRTMPESVVPQTVYGNYSSLGHAGMGSPLLFGAGGGPWSTGTPRGGYRNVSPPNGNGNGHGG